MTFEQIEHVVKTNDKQRFSLIQDNDGQQWWIRANQGHSIRHAIDPDALLERLSEPLPVVIHGTTMHNWRNCIQEQGLRVMNRQHIHFATGLPGTDGVISGNMLTQELQMCTITLTIFPTSGMRSSSEVFIYIDMAKAIKGKKETISPKSRGNHSCIVIQDGIIFYRSSNNVILTEGIGGTLPPTYFQKVTNRNGESLLLQPE